jgi:hypothetical protein
VVLVSGSKAAIEDNFNTVIDKRDLFKTKVVFRSGEPQSISSLQQVTSTSMANAEAVLRASRVVLRTCAWFPVTFP